MIFNVSLERLREDIQSHFKHQESVGENLLVKKFRNKYIPSIASGVAVVTPDLLKVAPEFRYTLVII